MHTAFGRNPVIGLLALALLFLAGCTTFTYDGQTYTAKQDAINAVIADLEKKQRRVVRRSVGGTTKALVVVPTKRELARTGINYFGKPSSVSADAIDYLSETMRLDGEYMSQAFAKSNLFREITQTTSDFPRGESFQERDYILYWHVEPARGAWYLKSRTTDREYALTPLPGSELDVMERIVASLERSLLDDQMYAAGNRASQPPDLDRSRDEHGVYGSCVVISPNGVIATAAHVIANRNQIRVRLATGEELDAVVVKISQANDIAVLRVDVQTSSYVNLVPTTSVELGDHVFTIGFPAPGILGPDPKYSEGTISSLSGLGGDGAFFQISIPLQPGNSGGPLVDKNGNLIGIVIATASAPAFLQQTGSLPQNVNWAVKSDLVASLSKSGFGSTTHVKSDVVASVKNAVCQVLAQ